MKKKLILLAMAQALFGLSAHAELNLTGPTSQATGNFPQYYQDNDSLALDLCLPAPGIERDSGLCRLLPEDIDPNNPNAVISFPTVFPEEAFWWGADSTLTLNDGKEVSLRLALEAAFANGGPAPNDQIVFARTRIKLLNPTPGHYKFIHPYGTVEVTVKEGDKRIFETEDFGALCGTDFYNCETRASKSRIGPFLRPSNAAGGAPSPFVDIGGKTYISDGVTEVHVTGSPFNQNYFAVEKDGVEIKRTEFFTVMGKVHTGPLPSNTKLERATYSRAGGKTKIDIYANAFKALGQTDPELKVFGKGMPGKALVKNPNKANQFYTQVVIPGEDLPTSVTLTDLRESPVRTFPISPTDLVTVKKATYDNGTLHVEATSSDESTAQTGSRPKLTVQGSDGADFGVMTLSNNDYTLDKTGVTVPPQKVIVISDRGGSEDLDVDTSIGTDTPVKLKAENDDFANSTAPMNVIGNDTLDGAPVTSSQVKVLIDEGPDNGMVKVNADNTVSFTQGAAATGQDTFTYYLTNLAGDVISNIASATFQLTSGNLPPVANPDTASASAGATITIDVLANDTDPEHATLTLQSVTGTGASVVGGKVQFIAPATPGNQTLQYVVSDGTATATGTVTVTVSAAENIPTPRAELRTNNRQLRIDGTDTPVTLGVRMTIFLNNVQIATTTTDATGAWSFKKTFGATETLPTGGSPVKVVSERGAQAITSLSVKN